MAGLFQDLNENCTQSILRRLECKKIALLRKTCRYWYELLDETTWWEFFAERYCELYPEIILKPRFRGKGMQSTLGHLRKKYGHLYDVEWSKRSLAAVTRRIRNAQGNRWRRYSATANLTACPPDDLAELITLCVIQEIYLKNCAEIQRLTKYNNKHYNGVLNLKTTWDNYWKHGNTINDLWVINPLTGKPLRKDSKRYALLCSQGYF